MGPNLQETAETATEDGVDGCEDGGEASLELSKDGADLLNNRAGAGNNGGDEADDRAGDGANGSKDELELRLDLLDGLCLLG